MKQWICALESGEASLIYPADLSKGSEQDLLEWLALVQRVLSKRFSHATEEPGDSVAVDPVPRIGQEGSTRDA